MSYYDNALLVRADMNKAGALLTDAQAASVPTLYELWAVGIAYEKDKRIQYDGAVYAVQQAHTSQADWLPNATPALYTRLNVEHAGTIDDPIPAVAGMLYVKDLYYVEGEDTYLCIRQDTAEGTVLHYLPSQLVGVYFEKVE